MIYRKHCNGLVSSPNKWREGKVIVGLAADFRDQKIPKSSMLHASCLDADLSYIIINESFLKLEEFEGGLDMKEPLILLGLMGNCHLNTSYFLEM